MKISGKEVIVRELNRNIYQRLINDGYSEVVARIFAGRNTLPSAYLDGQILKKETLHNAVLGGEIIAKHIMAGNTIACSVDYDIDGLGSLAVLARAIKGFGGKVIAYCPDREVGYGINKDIVHSALNDGCKLVVTADNGIMQFEAIAEAKRLGLDVVLTDHHMMDKSGKLPIADAIINPWAERGKEQFASKNICGATVAWYVMACTKDYLDKCGWKHRFTMKSVVDFVACSSIGDMVLMDLQNLKIVKHGIEKLNSENISVGLKALLDVSGKNESTVTSQTIGFTLAPMINSCSRLGSAQKAMDLVVTDDEDVAFEIATEIKATNDERKKIQKQMSDIAIENLALDVSSHSVCILNNDFKQGVIGLIASKVKDMTYKPSGVFTMTANGYIKGSFRSIVGVNVRDALDLVNKIDPSINFIGGGHSGAAAGRLDPSKWNDFKVVFNQAVSEIGDKEAFKPNIHVDGEISDEDINLKLVEDLSNEIWGQGLPSPMFIGYVTIKDQKILNGAHCKFTARIGRMEIPGIFFGREFALPEKCWLTYTLDINVWNGNKNIQMMVNGISEAERLI